MTGTSTRVEYSSTRRITPASMIVAPSSLKATAPASPEHDHLRHHLALEPARRRRDREDPGRRLLLGPIEDVLRHRRVVVHRIGVGHAGDLREAAGDRGRATAREIFLVLLARRAQMGVEIDQAGHDPGPAGLEHVGPLGRKLGPHGGDAAVLDQAIEGRRPCPGSDRAACRRESGVFYRRWRALRPQSRVAS